MPHQQRISQFKEGRNGSGSGLCRPCHSILRIPAHRRYALGSACRFGCPLKVDNFPGAVRLFLVARRAPKIKDLGLSQGRLGPLVGSLQAPDDGGNRNGCFAMQAYDAAESRAFGFNGHDSILTRLRFRSLGSSNPTLKRPARSSRYVFLAVEIGG